MISIASKCCAIKTLNIFLRIIPCHSGIGYEEKVEEENLDSGMVAEAKRKRSL